MVACIHSDPLCEHCARGELYNQQNVIIAQLQRLLDLQERDSGYQNIPINFLLNSTPVTATDYKFPSFEIGCFSNAFSYTTDATAVRAGLYVYHESIIGGKQLVLTFQGTGKQDTGMQITIPAKGTLGINIVALTGGTYLSMTADIRRSEQTGIEWFRSLRAGRVG